MNELSQTRRAAADVEYDRATLAALTIMRHAEAAAESKLQAAIEKVNKRFQEELRLCDKLQKSEEERAAICTCIGNLFLEMHQMAAITQRSIQARYQAASAAAEAAYAAALAQLENKP